MKTELPFPLDPNYDYILTEDDRRRFAPLQVTDETWIDGGWVETFNTPAMGFGNLTRYRRRKTALPQPPRPAAEVAFEEWWGSGKGYSERYSKEKPEVKGVARDSFLAAIEWAKAHKGEK